MTFGDYLAIAAVCVPAALGFGWWLGGKRIEKTERRWYEEFPSQRRAEDRQAAINRQRRERRNKKGLQR